MHQINTTWTTRTRKFCVWHVDGAVHCLQNSNKLARPVEYRVCPLPNHSIVYNWLSLAGLQLFAELVLSLGASSVNIIHFVRSLQTHLLHNCHQASTNRQKLLSSRTWCRRASDLSIRTNKKSCPKRMNLIPHVLQKHWETTTCVKSIMILENERAHSHRSPVRSRMRNDTRHRRYSKRQHLMYVCVFFAWCAKIRSTPVCVHHHDFLPPTRWWS